MNHKVNLTELTRVFDIEYGNKFDLNKMKLSKDIDSAVLFVGRSGINNGISAYVQKFNDTQPYSSGLITVALGGSILSSFIQPDEFYTGQNVAVLSPKKKMKLSEKAYYCICIEKNRHRYGAFGREANRTLKTLLVPSRDNIPSWVSSIGDDVLNSWRIDFNSLLQDV